MANAAVEKLKAFGIRHGEKVAAGLFGAAALGMIVVAWQHPVLDITPDQIKRSADAADANLRKDQKPEDILKKLDDEGLKESGFELVVDARKPGAADATKYRLANAFTAPEPGAGLIRDMPQLVAVTRLLAHAGRGAIEVFETDADNNIIMMDPDEAEKKPASKKKKSGRNTMAGMMSGGMMGEMDRRAGGGDPKKSTDAEKKAEERAEAKRKRAIAGEAGPEAKADPKAETKDAPEEAPKGTEKKKVQGFRWVALIGTLDHKQMRDNYAKALRLDPSGANPDYSHVDLERQQRDADGNWGEWQAVDRKFNQDRVLMNVVEKEPAASEVAPADTRLEPLVDILPFLKVGYYEGVHHGAVIPVEKEKPKAKAAFGGKGGGAAGGKGRGLAGMPGGMGGEDYEAMMGGRGGMFGGGGGGGAGDAVEHKTEAETIMIRALDFTVVPDATYRYRVRVAVKNPNYKLDNVSPGVDNKSKLLRGPWSEPSDVVGVPADVSTYVIGPAPATPNGRTDRVQFQVARFNPEDGLIAVRSFDQAPGEIVGKAESISVPRPDQTGLKSAQVDFTSRQFVVDTAGGPRRAIDSLGLQAPRFSSPSTALVIRPDGLLVLHDQSRDASNGEMKELKDIYDSIIKDASSGKKKESSNLGGMGGMMGGGMMMGGEQ